VQSKLDPFIDAKNAKNAAIKVKNNVINQKIWQKAVNLSLFCNLCHLLQYFELIEIYWIVRIFLQAP
jgi:hypothetical protein